MIISQAQKMYRLPLPFGGPIPERRLPCVNEEGAEDVEDSIKLSQRYKRIAALSYFWQTNPERSAGKKGFPPHPQINMAKKAIH